ncbi:MAG TPA: ATP-binding protein [Acidimicrobiales bacterium]|nr:ATP-binding protein [Acidimicrobiales bacterium]
MKRLRTYLAGEASFPIAVLFMLNAVDELDTRLFEVLGPDIAKDFGVGVGTFGIINAIGILVVPLIAVPIASAGDRGRRMPIAIMGAAAWGTFSLLTGVAPVIGFLMVMRAGASMGKVVNGPIHYGLIGDFYSPRSRTRAFGIHSLANPVGGVVAAVVGGALADALGWRVPFLLFGVPVVAAILIALRLGEPERGRFEIILEPQAPPLRVAWRQLYQLRSLRYQWFGLAWCGGAVVGIGTLVPFFLEDEFGVTAFGRGAVIGTAQVVATLATLVGTSLMQDRANARPSNALRLLAWAGVAAGAALAACAVAPNLATFLLPLFVIFAVFALVTPGLAAIGALVAPPDLRSMSFAVGGVVALAGLPFAVIGAQIGDANLRWALALMTPVFLRGVAFFFQAAKYLDDDISRLDPDAPHRGPTGGDIVLSCRDVTVSYGPVQVLFGVDLEVRRGEIVALLGTNGSGKSTILNAISGLVEPTGGNIWFNGDYITTERPERIVAAGLVQAPGGKGVFPGLSVEDNLRMSGFLLRRDHAELDARISRLLELFPRLAERAKQRAGDLSGGERQMLTIAGAFLLQPTLLMIDELSLGLAPSVVQELLKAVRAMNEAGTTILLVEQSVNVALTLADHAYFLEKGEVRFHGRTSDLLQRDDLLRSVFLEGARLFPLSP